MVIGDGVISCHQYKPNSGLLKLPLYSLNNISQISFSLKVEQARALYQGNSYLICSIKFINDYSEK